MNTVSLNVNGMSCNHCVSAIEKALGGLNGVRSVDVDLAANKVTVSYEEKTVSLDQVKEAIEDQGYDVV